LLFALGIPNAGEGTAKRLNEHYGSLDAIMNASLQELQLIDDIGPIVASSIVKYFGEQRNKLQVYRLRQSGVTWPEGPKKVVQITELTGKIFVLTGTLPTLEREVAKTLIEDVGGKISGTVSSKTSYLVAGDNAGTKYDKAVELGIPILDEAGLKLLLGDTML
jgi:DNA ligase (NAD+)